LHGYPCLVNYLLQSCIAQSCCLTIDVPALQPVGIEISVKFERVNTENYKFGLVNCYFCVSGFLLSDFHTEKELSLLFKSSFGKLIGRVSFR
jgi:hypothetical protein